MSILDAGDARADAGDARAAAGSGRTAGDPAPTRGEGVDPSGPRWRSPTAAALAVTVIGVAVRIWIITRTSLKIINGDEAVTGVMVQRILSGQGHYIFYAGQQYNGSLEQYLQAAMYWLFRLPQNAFTLRLPQIAMMAASIWLIYLVGCRLLQRPWAAVVAAALYAVGPYWTIRQGIGTFGSYPDLIVVGLVALYCSLRMGEPGRRGLWWGAGFAFCCGMVAWLGLSGVELLIPAALLAAPYFVRSWRLWAVGVPALLLGMSPLLVWSVKNGKFALLDAGPAVLPSTFGSRIHDLFGPVLREFIGVGYGNGVPGWPLTLQYLAVAALGLAYLVAVIRRWHGILAILTLRLDRPSPFDALLVTIPITVLLYSSSKWAWYSAEPRYLFASSPILVFCLAAALPARPRPIRVVAVLVGTAIFAATSLTMLANRPYNARADQTNDMRAAVTYLTTTGQTHGYADYWTAMPMLYLSRGTLDIAPLAAGRGRFPDVTAASDQAADTFYVSATPNSKATTGGKGMEKAFAAHHVTFHRVRIGSLVVYDHLSPALKPWQLGLGLAPAPPKV